MIDRSASPQPLASLLKAVDAGDLGLPEFQRQFIWSPGDVVDLLRTIARGWPCGTFLLQEGATEFAAKPLDSAPPLRKRPRFMVLDGQQRITAAYHALREHGDETYYVDMKQLSEAGALDDDHVRFMKAKKYRKRYPSVEEEARERIIRVATLTRDADFFEWASCLKPRERERVIQLRDEELSGFKHYSIPSVILNSETPLAAIAKIFETINRTGVRLDTFDLMVAKMYPFDFKLRDQWDKAVDRHPLTLRAYDVKGIDILKLIALREHLRQVDEDFQPLQVKGVRESDVISLNAETVKREWKAAVLAYDAALSFMRSECGVVSASLVPSSSMTLALADALNPADGSRPRVGNIRQWFWTSCVNQSYAQGANTQVVRDARALRSWRSKNSVPEFVEAFSGVDEEGLQDSRRRNEVLLRAAVSAVVLSGAKDWLTGIPLTETEVDLHMICPRSLIREHGEDPDTVVNFTVLSRESAKKLRGLTPSELTEAGVSLKNLKTHSIVPSLLYDENWQELWSKRAREVGRLLTELSSGV